MLGVLKKILKNFWNKFCITDLLIPIKTKTGRCHFVLNKCFGFTFQKPFSSLWWIYYDKHTPERIYFGWNFDYHFCPGSWKRKNEKRDMVYFLRSEYRRIWTIIRDTIDSLTENYKIWFPLFSIDIFVKYFFSLIKVFITS